MSCIGSGLGIGLGIGLGSCSQRGLQYFEFGLPEGPLVLTTEAALVGLSNWCNSNNYYLPYFLQEKLPK
jgi:hypothetical protein